MMGNACEQRTQSALAKREGVAMCITLQQNYAQSSSQIASAMARSVSRTKPALIGSLKLLA